MNRINYFNSFQEFITCEGLKYGKCVGKFAVYPISVYN